MDAVIQTSRLTKSYGRARGILAVDLEVPGGEVFGFLGPNGAGKSTLIRTLLDLLRPTSGSASVLGLDSRRDAVGIHRRTGYLSGDLELFPRLTGAEHLAWFDRVRGRHDPAVAAALTDRLAATLDRPVRELSTGNRQKVGLLLALAHEPELVILDEPTRGLDPLVQDELHRYLREVAAAGRTVLLSSHSLDEVQRVAHRVAIIREGELIVTDTVQNLRDRAPRSVTITFAGDVPAEAFASLPGVLEATAHGPELALRVTGSLDAVVKQAARHEVIDLVARHADLEELFLAYYRGDQAAPDDA